MSSAEDFDWYSNDAATFGDRVAAGREALGMSQKQLSRRLGVALKTVENWEYDMSEPRANKLQMLAGVLNVSITWLLTGEGEGVTAPDVANAPSQVSDILTEMRALRTQMMQSSDRLGVLEKRLREVTASAAE